MRVSIFENFKSAGREVGIDYVEGKIRNGGTFSQTIATIRELNKTNVDAANDLKKTLPGVTFCGLFQERQAKKLIKSTGLIILDFDGLDDSLEDARSTFMADPYVYMLFVSPRGNGLKMLIRIPEVKDDKEFKTYFFALQKKYPQADPSGKDISRFCFVSHDPDLYVNYGSEIWEEKIEQGVKESNQQVIHTVRTDFKKLSVGVAMIDNAEVGNRNNTILKAGRLMGGYIASGELNELDVLDICQRAIERKDPHDSTVNFNTFRRGLENGKTEPLTSAQITELEVETKIGKIDYLLDDVSEKIDEIYDNGLVRGYSTGWKHFDIYYSIRPGYTTYIYGAPYTGKTILWFNILVNLSISEGLKHLIYSPETGDASEIYSTLMQIYAQADITSTYRNQMTKEQREEAKKFIAEHFVIISTDESDTEISVKDFLNYVDVLENKYKIKFDTITIDPWNELLHDENARDDRTLNIELKAVRVNARKHQRHICVITHIRDLKPTGYDEFGTAIYPFPTSHDVAGGQVWYRKGFMMLAFYRHFVLDGYNEVKIGKDRFFHKNALFIRVQKSKPEGVGRRGEIEFRYHSDIHRFSDPMGVMASLPKHEETTDLEDIPF